MIKVIDDWYIEVESNPTNYTIKRGKGERDKNGKNRDKIYGYYGSLLNALKALRKEIVTDKLKGGTYTLVEAVDTIVKEDTRFEKIMERVTV